MDWKLEIATLKLFSWVNRVSIQQKKNVFLYSILPLFNFDCEKKNLIFYSEMMQRMYI